MARDLHVVSLLPLVALAMEDRLHYGHYPNNAHAAGNGTVTAIAPGAPGAGYQTIPTVAITVPASGAKSTGSAAAATAVMGVVANPTIAAAGSGGTNGAAVVTGTTGTGTKFQANVTIAGGAITAVNSVAVAGAYTAMPTTLAAEPVTGAGLTGATLNLSAAMGVVSYTVGTPGSNYPIGFTTAAVSGGTPVTAAVPGAVTVTPANGALCSFDVALLLPAAYAVQATPSQDATCWISNKTQTGFTVNVAPRLASAALVAGSIDLMLAA